MAIGWRRRYILWYYRVNNSNLLVPVRTDWVNLLEILKDSLSDLVDEPRNAGVKITSFTPLSYSIVPESAGLVFAYDKIILQIQNNLSRLDLSDIAVKAESFEPIVKFADAQKAAENLTQFLSYGDISLNYIDPQTKARRDWVIAASEYANWLEVEKTLIKIQFLF